MTAPQIALITGASSGIGQATAAVLAKEGFDLILLARRIERLQELANKLAQQYQITCLPLACDIQNKAAIDEIYDALPRAWQAVDVLINNAGLAAGLDKVQTANIDDWEQMIDTNIKGLLYVTRKFLPKMIDNDRGHIINLGSISGHGVYTGGTVYCATKFAVDALCKGLRLDLLGTNIRVTEISPGLVETEFSLVRFKGNTEKAQKTYEDVKALTPEDIADVIRYAINCPPHVNISEVIIMPTAQAGIGAMYKQQITRG